MIAVDTSALAKLVVAEPETAALMDALRGHVVVASELVRTELRRAVLRAAPEHIAGADAVLARLTLVRLDRELLDAAGRLQPPRLRTLDAIHIQAALLLRDEVSALVTYDARQAAAARAAGLEVQSPL